MVLAVALDSGGPEAVRPWVERASPSYPCLIDTEHLVARLYGIVNVPTAVWIDEAGRIVRPPEPAGASDTFRRMDRATGRLPEDAAEERRLRRQIYMDAVRDWAARGEASVHVLPPEEVRRRLAGPGREQSQAAAHFRLGLHLYRQGRREEGLRHLWEAARLHPESWAYKRQAWELEEPGKAAGPEFWAAVEALGDRPYYPPIEMVGMPPYER